MKLDNRIVFFAVFFIVFLGWGLTSTYAVPSNDNFVDATVLSGAAGSVNASNLDATAETGEPNHGDGDPSPYSSIWFSWTAPSSCEIVFSTLGSDFDTVMAAYTGTVVGSLTKMAENDDSELTFQSLITFTAVEGITYSIAVDGYSGEQGNVSVKWEAAAANDNFSAATALTEAAGTVSANNIGATAETGEPNHGDGDPSPYSSIWFNWTAPSSSEFTFNTFGSDFDTVMAAYTGTAVDSLTKLTENDNSGADFQSLIIFTVVAGTTYSIAVDGYTGEQGNVLLNWGSAPANDNFVDATVLSGATGTVSATNLAATAETGESNHGAGSSPYSSVWFSWTAPSSGEATFNTFGSGFDTVMAAYTGTAVDSLTKLAENDDYGADFQSLITFTAVAGTTYSIAVDGYTGDQGNVLLNWGVAPSNDNFSAATVLSGATGTVNASNLAATAETGEPNHGDGDSSAYLSVWFSWTAPSSGEATFNTFGSGFDTVMAAYTGTAVDSLTKLAGNDNSGADFQSLITFTAVAGTTYSIAVDGYIGDQGNVLLNFDLTKKFPWPAFLAAILNSPSL